ncbi:unnamed protein product [Moneuplotes crassus]|uniref:RING-type domain-containing protein n=1 Tax=Euplotes crassus TaxID=5936 RepID=A0AAD1XIH5_EUPCR|nr:unnamed protein product [Moneuplotes crassus]
MEFIQSLAGVHKRSRNQRTDFGGKGAERGAVMGRFGGEEEGKVYGREESKDEHVCPICLVGGFENKIVSLLNSKAEGLEEYKQKSRYIFEPAPWSDYTEKNSYSAIIYINSCDFIKITSIMLSELSKDVIKIVEADDLTYNTAHCLAELESDGACILKRCKHIFHKECMKSWIKLKNTCPVCRDEIYQKRAFEQSNSFQDESGLMTLSSAHINLDSDTSENVMDDFEADSNGFMFPVNDDDDEIEEVKNLSDIDEMSEESSEEEADIKIERFSATSSSNSSSLPSLEEFIIQGISSPKS